MGVSTTKVVIISIFLIIGMFLPGLVMQPKASFEAWDVKESDFPANASSEEKLTFLLRYAILAPSTYNTQPWKFNVSDGEIRIYADESRWLHVVDEDKRELYISLGCSLENLIVAADHFGYNCSVEYFPGPEDDLVAKVALQPESPLSLDPRLFSAITSRQTNRNPYDEQSIADYDLHTLESLSPDKDARIFLTSDSAIKNKFLDLTVKADQIHYSDVNFKSELGHWLGQGAMGHTGVQAKIDQMEVVFLDNGPGQIRTDAELINSSPNLGFISTGGNDAESSVKAGQTFEHLWLMANTLGMSLQPMSQALEVPETKSELSKLLPANAGSMAVVQQTFRLGIADPVKEHSPRRPLVEVMV